MPVPCGFLESIMNFNTLTDKVEQFEILKKSLADLGGARDAPSPGHNFFILM